MTLARTLLASCALLALPCLAHAQSASPWPAGDELGMANTLGPATWKRCAPYLANPRAKSYELSHIRSNTMPQSPFGTPLRRQVPADRRHPRHHARLQRRGDGERRARRAGHADGCDRPFRRAAGEVGRQERLSRRQGEVLRRLHAEGREAHAGLAAAEARHREGAADRHHRGAARRQDPSRQGQGDGAGRARHREGHRGDAEGAGARQARPAGRATCSTSTPAGATTGKTPTPRSSTTPRGRGSPTTRRNTSREKKVVLVALDNPFTDPVADGFLQGKAAPPEGAPDGLPFAIHHHNLSQSGIHQIQNANLGDSPRTRSGCRAP